MSRNSSGGMGAARGEGHQAGCFAWAAAYLLAEERLPDFALGRRILAIGAQTERAVDDLALLTEDDGWVVIQAKKGLRVTSNPSGDLAAALAQVAELARVGLPTGPGAAPSHRPVDPERDRVLIVADETAVQAVDRALRPLLERLRTLPSGVPLGETARKKAEREGLALLRQHVGSAWQANNESPLSEADFRIVCRSLGIQVLDLSSGGRHRIAAEQLLSTLLPETDSSALWELLLAEGHRVAREGAYLGRGELVRRLAVRGIVLAPVSRLRPDIQRLRDRTATNLRLLGNSECISAPDGVVRVRRSAMARLAGSVGNVAITGGSGTGKSAELYRTAVALRGRGRDVVVLRADDLRGTEGQTRQELNLAHDLADVLLGWSGADGATLMLDGLDQTRGEDVSSWISTVAHRLAGTRWRIVATIRAYDLRHGRRWRGIFYGTPVDPAHADPTLAEYQHICLGDFTGAELALVSAQSARLAEVLDRTDPGMRALLANPFNLDLAAQLLRSEDLDLVAVRRRIDLLHQFWAVHAYRHDAARIVVLRAVVLGMVAAGRQAVGTDLDGVDHALLRLLCSDGVLRELPLMPGHAAPDVGFAHPVLFDYAVALLALGDLARPASLADVLDRRPNLALVLRASIEFRLAMIWRQDETRATFWRLGARLASHGTGHPFVALQAAQVAVAELRTVAECAELADLCTAATHSDGLTETVADARRLAYLVAVLAGRCSDPQVADVVMDLAGNLSTRAEGQPDLALARLAAQASLRLVDRTAEHLHERLAAAAAGCATLAMANARLSESPLVAESAVEVLAQVISTGGRQTVDVITRLCQPEVIQSWDGAHLGALTQRIGEIARADPGLAVTVGAAAWYSTTTTHQQRDVHGIRANICNGFAALADTDLLAATTLLLTVVESSDMYPRPPDIEFEDPPRPRAGISLTYPIENSSAHPMTVIWIDRLRRLAERTEPARARGEMTAELTTFGSIVEQIVADLRHAEVWERLLRHAATADDPALARGLLPALTSPNLYAAASTWVAAAHLVRRLSPELEPSERAAIERAISGRSDEIRTGGLPALTDPDRDSCPARRAGHRSDPSSEPDLDDVLMRSVYGAEADRAAAIHTLIDAWPTPMEDRLRRSIAVRLAHETEVSLTELAGPSIYETLRSVELPDPTAESIFAMLGNRPTELMLPGTPEAEVLTGLAGLARRPECRTAHPELTSLLAPFLDSPEPAYRYLVARAVPYLLPDGTDPIAETGRRLVTEANRHVTAQFLQALKDHIGSHAPEVDELLARMILSRSTWAYPLNMLETHDHVGMEIVDAPYAIIAELAVANDAAYAPELVRAWLDRPGRCHRQIGHLMHSLRNILNPAEESRRPAQRRAFALLEHGARACRDALRGRKKDPDNGATEPADTDEVTSTDGATWATQTIGRGIQTACGADRPKQQSGKREDPTFIADLALPVLTILAEIPDRTVTRSVVETCKTIGDHRPVETLKIVANAVTQDEAYGRAISELNGILALAQRYVAEHHELLRSDDTCLTALRQLLEVCILTGQDEAIDLIEQLDDLFG